MQVLICKRLPKGIWYRSYAYCVFDYRVTLLFVDLTTGRAG